VVRSELECSPQRLVTITDETPREARGGGSGVEAMDGARVDVQFDGDSGLLQALGVVKILVDEQVQIAYRQVGGRTAEFRLRRGTSSRRGT
jgi:hypothetical protein